MSKAPASAVRDALVAGATGFKTYPLSERDAAWDASAADTRWREKSGSEEAPSATYRNGFFWFDAAAADQFGSYKLGYVDAPGGTTTAIWRGVTAAAGAVQGARGGVKIPEGDVVGVKATIAKWYAKAAKQYEDETITPPWEASAETSAAIRAFYTPGGWVYVGALESIDPAALVLAHAEALGDADAFAARLAFWEEALSAETAIAALAARAVDSDAPEPQIAALAERALRRLSGAGLDLRQQVSAGVRRESVLAALTAAGVEPTASEPLTTFDLTRGSLGERAFFGHVLLAGFRESRSASWPCDADLGEHGEVLYRADDESVFRLEDGSLVYAGIGRGWLHMRVASEQPTGAAEAISTFSSAYPPLYRSEDDIGLVPITFWFNTQFGPSSRLRMIEAGAWAEIERNYSGEVREQLARLMSDDFAFGEDGQLLLWQGEPGTGKSWALRALASEWRDRCEFHYITDPDSFFVSDPSYMVNVLLHETYDELTPDGDVVASQHEGKWRVLILEDTGELLSANAKEQQGQGVSRLLNVVDGMLGQGLRVLALLTTNDELGELHPAAVRPDLRRCASQIAFGSLSAEEAADWLGEGQDVDAPMTLAELYAYARNEEAEEAFAPEPMPADECANCGHDFSQHEQDGSVYPCTVAGCDCEAFAMATPDVVEESTTVTLASLWGDSTVRLGDTVRFSVVSSSPGISTNGGETASALRLEFQSIEEALPAEHQPGAVLPPRRASPEAPVTEQPTRSTVSGLTWEATLAPEGLPTDDGRIFAPGAITWRELPLTLMAMLKTEEGHDGAEVAGRIDRVWREGDLIRASGVFEDSDFGRDIASKVGEGILRGVSVDLAIREYEIVPRASVLDENGRMREVPLETEEAQGEDLIDVLFGEQEEMLFLVTDAVIGMATVCGFPAFAEASISLLASGAVWRYTHQGGFIVTARGESLVASAVVEVPVAPPAEWFADPALERLTALTIDDDGRVYGHAAAWEIDGRMACHLGFPDVCVPVPHSAAEYRYMHLGEIACADGSRVPCGKITLGTGHADPRFDLRAAVEHYDDTGTVVADVVTGEDEHGIWVAGALRPDLEPERVRELRAAVLSGDWRGVNGNLELCALLAVNVPGFPVPRAPRALVASGEPVTLVSAGIHAGSEFAEDDLRRIAELAERASESGRISALAERALAAA